MTLTEANDLLRRIEQATDDPEVAHGLEDDLHMGILRTIAFDNPPDPHILAAVGARTSQIKFPRWCA